MFVSNNDLQVIATLFDSGKYTLFWRELQYVAKYAFVVLFLFAKIFICAIFHAFSISGHTVSHSPSFVIQLTVERHMNVLNFRLPFVP